MKSIEMSLFDAEFSGNHIEQIAAKDIGALVEHYREQGGSEHKSKKLVGAKLVGFVKVILP